MLRRLFIPLTLVLALFSACQQTSDSSPAADAPVTMTGISVTPSVITNLQVSEQVPIVVKAVYSNGTTKTVSSQAAFSAGAHYSFSLNVLTSTAEGSGTITVTYQDFTADLPYTMVDNYTNLELFAGGTPLTSVTADIGDDLEFTAVVTLKDGSTQEVTPADGLVLSRDGFFCGTREITDGSGTKTVNVLHAVDGMSGNITATFKSRSASVAASVGDFAFGARRFLPAEITSRKAVAYSGYRTGDSPNTQTYPEKSEILEDLQLLEEAGFSFLRLFDTSVHAYRTIENIDENNLDMKVQLGVWIAGSDAAQGIANWEQIEGALDLIASYPDVIASVSIGNECMVDWNTWASCPPADIRRYVQYMRSRVSVPVTTDDNWEPFAKYDIQDDPGEDLIGPTGALIYRNGDVNTPYETDQVAEVIDYLALHTYPIADSPYGIWSWQRTDVEAGPARGVAMMDLALKVAQKQYQAARDHLTDDLGLSDMPIIISETGWKHADTSNWPGRSHPVNAKMYYDRINDWVYGSGRAASAAEGPWVCFYFEAFDEPWKLGDDGWGFWDKDRNPLYALWAQSDSDSIDMPVGGTAYTDDDVAYYGM